jgi:hypothetical protein
VAAILVEVLKCRTQFWKRTTQESSQQSLVEIGSVVSEQIFFLFHPPFFLICIIGQIGKSSKFIKNPVIYVQNLIMLKTVQIWAHSGIMMSFLTYIMGFFMNFELLPILSDYAK